MIIDTSKMENIKDLKDNGEDYNLYVISKEAKEFIESFPWCSSVINGYLGEGYDEILGVFLFEIESKSLEVDKFLWVVCGDIPPAYLVIDHAKSSTEALDLYVFEMKKWVTAVENGESIEELIPVNVQPSLKYAKMLDVRLNFIRDEILNT